MYLVTTGAWYPRTTLHLTEVFEFLNTGTSNLPLNQDQLSELRSKLDIHSITREVGDFESIVLHTNQGITFRYYEDGLYIAEHRSSDVHKSTQLLTQWVSESLNPALSYIFSLGAPTPKVLANIIPHHPIVITLNKNDWSSKKFDAHQFGGIHSQITSHGTTVYKTPTHIFITTDRPLDEKTQTVIEMQIFFREFKDQLARYLNIHRTIWEEISHIKERKTVSGTQLGHMRHKLDGYHKTINLITNRINQMNAYIQTRSKIAREQMVEDQLNTLFQYKFEALRDTHTYITEVWKMTSDYIRSAIQIVVELQNQSTQKSIQSLQLITLASVVSGLLAHMTINKLPTLTPTGVIYILGIIVIAWVVNAVLLSIFTHAKYQVQFPEQAKL